MQSINFYFEEYHPKPLSFDSRFFALVLLLCLIGLVAISWIEQSKLNELKRDLAAKQAQSQKLQQEVADIQKKLSVKKNFEVFKSELAANKQELLSYKKLAAAIETPQKQQSVEYSKIFLHLSKQIIHPVWLTQIQINEDQLTIKGSSTDVQAIPKYVNQLNQVEVLKRYFDELKILRNEDNNRVVDFQLTNGKLIDEQPYS